MAAAQQRALPPDPLLVPRMGPYCAAPKAGAAPRQRLRTCRSLSPTYMLMSSGPLTERKFAAHCVATAFARSVFPLPGGPYSRTPLRRLRPPANSSLRRPRAGAGEAGLSGREGGDRQGRAGRQPA